MRLRSAELLRALMRARGLSHRSLAAQVGCSAGFVSHLTAGRRHGCTEPLATAIVEVLDVPLALLFMPAVPIAERQNVAESAA